jgi:hypothetical protein
MGYGPVNPVEEESYNEIWSKVNPSPFFETLSVGRICLVDPMA